MARRLRLVPAGIALLALAAVLVPAATAASRPCGDRVLDDWYDGRIDGVYAPECYAQALEALPEDVRAYSTAEEDINQALRQRLTGTAQAAQEDVAPAAPAPPTAAEPEEAGEPEQPQRSLSGRVAPSQGAAEPAPSDGEVVAAPAVEQPPQRPGGGAPAWALWAAALGAVALLAAAVPLVRRRRARA
jgi:hypothetical protein